jgi:hypothetical protein
METLQDQASAYRAAHYRKLMVLTTWRSAVPERDEFCRIRSVETLAPRLWITAIFLDGTVRRFGSEKIRPATAEEARQSGEAPAGSLIPLDAASLV